MISETVPHAKETKPEARFVFAKLEALFFILLIPIFATCFRLFNIVLSASLAVAFDMIVSETTYFTIIAVAVEFNVIID